MSCLHLDSYAFNQFRRFTEENGPYVKVDTKVQSSLHAYQTQPAGA